MAFSDNVEVISPSFGNDGQDRVSALESKKLQKQKWLVLALSFLIVSVIGLVWVWSRPPIYQSQAIIHFSYAERLNNQQAAVPEEQISLSQRRLTSYRILEAVSQQLSSELSLNLSPEALSLLLSTEANVGSRIINLYATGEQANLLQPVLDTWLNLYLQKLAEETVVNTEEDITLGREKLVALEEKIIEQRLFVEQYSEENNIISLERDENRTLAKIKSLGAALDQAETQQAEATASLTSVEQSIQQGQQVIHPADKTRLDAMRKSMKDIEAQLESLAQRYTAEYMNLDPNIVNLKRNLQNLVQRYEEGVALSQEKYIQDLARTVAASKDKQRQLEQQLDELGKEAQQFNQKLDEYARQTRSLKQLEEQAQQLKDQIVEKEVQKPFEAKISVMEAPFEPTYPISPLYWRDTGIVVAGAAGVSIFCLLLFSFVVRQKQPAATMTSYTVVPPSGLTYHAQQGAQQQALEQQRTAMLGHQAAPLQLEQQASVSHPRLLSIEECNQLYAVANRDGKLALSLVLSGVSPQEMLLISKGDFDDQTQALMLQGDFSRAVELMDDTAKMLAAMCVSAGDDSSLWPAHMTMEQFDQSIINMAHDAGLAYPEQLSLAALRHTYLTYLVTQGARLNDLEQLAGYVSPAQLSLYRQVNRRGEPVNLDQVNPLFPLS